MTRPRAGVPSALPHPTSTQFLLLLLMVSAASLFAGTWWGVLTRDGWTAPREECVRRAATTGAEPGTVTRCLNHVLLGESAVSLLGPLLVLALTGLAVLLTTFWRLRRWRRHPLPVPERTATALTGCLAEAGCAFARPPVPVVERRSTFGGAREEVRAYGLFGRRYVVVAHYTPLADASPRADESEGRVALAGLRHEVAHLRAGDVGRGRFAFHALWLLPLLVVLPLAVAAVGRPADLVLSLGWRLAAVTIVVLLAFGAFVRTREYEADAAVADREGMALAVEESLTRGRTRLPEFLRLHPDDHSRLRALREPGGPPRLLLVSCLIAGTAVGMSFQEVALLLETATGGETLLAYWLTGLLTGTALSAVVPVSLWRDLRPDAVRDARDVWDRHGTPYRLLAGALLGLALVTGSQLSPRAAASWDRLFPTALLPGDNHGLFAHRPLAALPLVAAAVAGGAAFVVWSRALAPARSPSPAASPRVRTRRGPVRLRPMLGPGALIALGGLVLSVPLALWFQAQRLVATSYVPPRVVGRLLLSPVVLGALCATGIAAPAVLWAARRWRPRTGVVLWSGALVGAALLPLTAVAAGTAIDRGAGPAPPLTRPSDGADPTGRVPERSLPIAPSATDPARDPAVEPALACYLFTTTPVERLHTPDGLREVVERMKVTRDAALRAIVLGVLDGLDEARTRPGEADDFDIGAAVRDIHAACKVVLTR
ncbi:M48 family metalloprotease [Streptomyces neyagawaensis]|uniref:M48 family metalloprotease n=1 Tax=Streptomyces neyagawaensis TaxID=42238 RepID=UPI0006E25C00|nr:M48 family metalloprotease [Streptomyces neyagawaensis]MCL6732217.1 M48 family metallopeptidase [Streptomyces neyagawaensis]MDE1682289.1 M48 family metalloprotease [Streptomyces neyagawaensis]